MTDFTAKQPAPLSPSAALAATLPPRSFWKEQWVTVLVAALVSAFVAAITAAGVTVVLNAGSSDAPWVEVGATAVKPGKATKAAGTLIQQGTCSVRSEPPAEVFYPIPFAGPPHVSLSGANAADCVLVEQRADHFKAKLGPNFPFVTTVTWKAEGLRGPAPGQK
jgi:hypothetical protein